MGSQSVRHDWVNEWTELTPPDRSVGKESACNAGDPSSIPGLRRSTGDGTGYLLQYSWASLVAQLVKNPPAMREIWAQSLGWEDPLEKGEFHGLSSPWGCKDSDMTEWLSLSQPLNRLWEHRLAHAATYSLTYSSAHFKWESDTSPCVLQLFSSMCLLPFPIFQMQRL